jgi:hypothetical protein
MDIFNKDREKKNDLPPPAGGAPGSGDTSAQQPVVLKKWRATNKCIYKGKFIAEGTVVAAAEMNNPNFKPVEKPAE